MFVFELALKVTLKNPFGVWVQFWGAWGSSMSLLDCFLSLLLLLPSSFVHSLADVLLELKVSVKLKLWFLNQISCSLVTLKVDPLAAPCVRSLSPDPGLLVERPVRGCGSALQEVAAATVFRVSFLICSPLLPPSFAGFVLISCTWLALGPVWSGEAQARAVPIVFFFLFYVFIFEED